MKKGSSILEDIARKVAQCLEEAEFEPELRSSDGEVMVAARRTIDGKEVRAVFHIADRQVHPFAAEAASEDRSAYRAKAAIRPTLAAQSASRCEPEPTDEHCAD